MSMKIFDCFTYFNEAKLLSLRINELYNLVDYFVLIEASETFSGNKKPFYFDEVKKYFEKWMDKIIQVQIDFPETNMTSWEREYYQRNCISKIVPRISNNSEDMIIISDADEIPNRNTISSLLENDLPVQLDVTQFFWNFNWQVPDHCNQGARPVVCLAKHLEESTPQDLRSSQLKRIEKGGWHFSFFSMQEETKYKIESFAHTEFNKKEYKDLEKIIYRIQNGIDPFDRFPLKYREIDSTYPVFLQKNVI